MNILLTGATGAIGQFYVPYLLGLEHNLCLLVRDISKTKSIFGVLINDSCQILSWQEFRNQEIEILPPELVIHLAGYSNANDDRMTLNKLISSNIILGTHLLDRLSTMSSVKYFINFGSALEYFENSAQLNPTNFYAATKTAFRSILSYYAAKDQFKSLHIVLYSVYGIKSSTKRILDYLLDGLNSERPIKVSPGEQRLDFIHIKDVVSVLKSVMTNLHLLRVGENIFYAGSGVSTSLREIAGLIEKDTGSKLNLEWGGRSYRERDLMSATAPLSKNIIPWLPSYTIEKGITEYVKLKN
jgi:CDP-paratose synthetase